MFIFVPHIPFWVEWFCDVSMFCLNSKINNKVSDATRMRFTDFFFIHLFCLPAGDLRSFHTLPVSGAQGCFPSGARSANTLQHSGGPDQPGFRLPAGGARKVAALLVQPAATVSHQMCFFLLATFNLSDVLCLQYHCGGRLHCQAVQDSPADPERGQVAGVARSANQRDRLDFKVSGA